MVKPWTPPTLFSTVADADQWNAVMSWAGQALPLTPPAQVRFVGAEPPDQALRGHVVKLSDLVRIVVAPLSFPFAALFGADMDVDEVPRLPDAIARRLDEAMLESLWRLVPDGRMDPPSIEATGDIGVIAQAAALPALERLQWLALDVEGLQGQQTGTAKLLIGCDVRSTLALLLGGALAPRQVRNGIGEKLHTPLARRLGSLRLSVAEARDLAVGDVVVLDELAGSTVVLAGLGHQWTFARDEKGFVLRDVSTGNGAVAALTEQDMSQSLGPTGGPDGLSVTVDFEIGQLQVPLNALSAWQPGTIIAFDPPKPAVGVTVTLRVNGRDVGTGDLIGVDDRLAVRLTRLFETTT